MPNSPSWLELKPFDNLTENLLKSDLYEIYYARPFRVAFFSILRLFLFIPKIRLAGNGKPYFQTIRQIGICLLVFEFADNPFN